MSHYVLDELEAYRALGPIAAGPSVMDGAGGPVCGCGAPSVDESGWCGRAHLDAELERLRRLEAAVLAMDDQKWRPIADEVVNPYRAAIVEARAAHGGK